jgi:hypothetical protein
MRKTSFGSSSARRMVDGSAMPVTGKREGAAAGHGGIGGFEPHVRHREKLQRDDLTHELQGHKQAQAASRGR